jgi:phasin
MAYASEDAPHKGIESLPGLTQDGLRQIGHDGDLQLSQEESMTLHSFEMPKFELPTGELPESYREWAKGSVAQVKDGYEKIKAATTNAADALASSYKVGADGALNYNVKLLNSARANSDAVVDLMGNLASATSYAEVFELTTAYVRKQCEATSAQGRELAELAQKVTADTVEPLKQGLASAVPKA